MMSTGVQPVPGRTILDQVLHPHYFRPDGGRRKEHPLEHSEVLSLVWRYGNNAT